MESCGWMESSRASESLERRCLGRRIEDCKEVGTLNFLQFIIELKLSQPEVYMCKIIRRADIQHPLATI